MNILCFGDSNTWGFDAENNCRFPKDIRWPGKLQMYFPFDSISEFGICDMTFGTTDPFYKACNGLENITPAIRANSPVDMVIISLGLNDCKKYLFNSVEKIVNDAGRLIYYIKKYSDLNTHEARVLVCGQCVLTDGAVVTYPQEFDSSSIGKAYKLNRDLKKLCEDIHVPYLEAPEVEFSFDGCHYSRKGHELFAQNIANYLQK